MHIPYNPTNNLPTFLARLKKKYLCDEVAVAVQDTENERNPPCVTNQANANLSEAQKELLQWHYKFGHTNFTSIQLVIKSGCLGK